MSTKLHADWLAEDPLGAAHWAIARLELLGGNGSQLHTRLCSALDGALLRGEYPELEAELARLATHGNAEHRLFDRNTTAARRAAGKLGWQHRGRVQGSSGWLEQWEQLLATLTRRGIDSVS